jgi:hypothetical protein
MGDNATNTTATGEVIPVNENSTRTSPSRKMVRAWNEMVDMVNQAARFMQVKGFPLLYTTIISSNTYRGFSQYDVNDIFQYNNYYGL